MSAIEYEILSEVASCNGPDSHGNSATELGRFGTWTEKSSEDKDLTCKSVIIYKYLKTVSLLKKKNK